MSYRRRGGLPLGRATPLMTAFLLCRADYDKYSEDPEFKPATRHSKDIFDEVGVHLKRLFSLSSAFSRTKQRGLSPLV